MITLATVWKRSLPWAVATLLLVILLPRLPNLLLAVAKVMTPSMQLVANLGAIGILALILAILSTPLEALGWWAGWYGDPIQVTTQNLGTVQVDLAAPQRVARYVIYLDGISQAKFDYLPDVEAFLNDLEKRLPQDMRLIRGLMPYSPMNRPLTNQNPAFAWFWDLAHRAQVSTSGHWLSMIINLRNLLVVAVSADSRYGPIYNRGTAQVLYNSLLHHGYLPDSGTPITLIGFSGGGQISMGAAPYLKEALQAPIDIISIAGVFSGNNRSLTLEHIYHLVGDYDFPERLGPICFPKRWKVWFLSYWNRTKRMGKVSLIDLGPVGHQVPGGVMDPHLRLPSGQTALEQTVDWVARILQGTAHLQEVSASRGLSNLDRYQTSPYNRPDGYPLEQVPPGDRYRPIANWLGRLILPTVDQRQSQAVPFEVHQAPPAYAHLIGQVVTLRWSQEPQVQTYLHQVTKDVHFSPVAQYHSQRGGVYPTRLNHWQLVDPLESLAGAHPEDDVLVALPEPVEVRDGELLIAHEPIQVSGRYYGLIQVIEPADDREEPEYFRVRHFHKGSQQFDGPEEVVFLPQVIPDQRGTAPFTNRGIERSPLNQMGWYIYGAPDAKGMFVVQAIAPRQLFQLQAMQAIVGRSPIRTYLKQTVWRELVQHKGTIQTGVLSHDSASYSSPDPGGHLGNGREGTRALVVHVYGGIGGNQAEPAAQGPCYFGHFAFGVATVIREPLTDELRFDIVYHQIYTHNPDGLIAGTLHWSRYLGDRQFGWIGLRPVSDILIEFAPFTEAYEVRDDQERSPLDVLIRQLEIMTARYRIGDGSGGTYVGPANNCAQDSNQSLYAALKQMQRSAQARPAFHQWMQQHPDQAVRLKQLEKLGKDLKWHLMPFGSARADWLTETSRLGTTLEDHPVQTLLRGLISWRTMLPRVASDSITECFLRQGATAWVLGMNQLGGYNPEIEASIPITF